MSTWKLQKLVYYAQAWHLVWDEKSLFDNRIEAWANGPVVRDLYAQHRGVFTVSALPKGDPEALDDDERSTVNLVLSGYGKLTGRQLSHLTHSERPWREAREGLGVGEPSTVPINADAMEAFYSALDADSDAELIESIDWSAREGS